MVVVVVLKVGPRWARASRLLVLVGSTAIGGCGAAETEEEPLPPTLRVAVSTDLEIPAALDGVRITVARGGTEVFAKSYGGAIVEGLPDSLLLENDQRLDDQGNPILTPITVRVSGSLQGEELLARSATLVFQNDEAKLLRLPLCEACIGVSCEAGQTCIRGACVAEGVDIDTLPADGEGVRLEGECAAD